MITSLLTKIEGYIDELLSLAYETGYNSAKGNSQDSWAQDKIQRRNYVVSEMKTIVSDLKKFFGDD